MCSSVDPVCGIRGQVFGDCVVCNAYCNASYMLHVPLHIDGFNGYISPAIAP